MPKIDHLQLLPVSLLESERNRIDELKDLARGLKLEFGWHYLLDISWILSLVENLPVQTIMDAGAGTGVIQWYLAEKGARVVSVDRMSRENLPARFRRRYHVEGMRPVDLSSTKRMTNSAGQSAKATLADWADRVKVSMDQSLNRVNSDRGKVIIYNEDLSALAEIPENSIDTIVAVSSLEHNTPEGLSKVVGELMRVLKPGGQLLATLGASRDQDWFHEPSRGWCYSESSLRQIFDISADTQSNFADYDRLMDDLISNIELKVNLASFYFKSGDNGMPWGKWNPEYQPVGVCKVKSSG